MSGEMYILLQNGEKIARGRGEGPTVTKTDFLFALIFVIEYKTSLN
jgi:hypothetical protein